jgi:hypothetical protein
MDITKAAAALGHKGGSVKSDAKTKASRENGKRGGRPKLYKHVDADGKVHQGNYPR